MMPTRRVTSASTDQDGYRSPYSARRTSRPSRATTASTSTAYDIDAELTATTRTGWQRYTFPADRQGQRAVQHRHAPTRRCRLRGRTWIGDRTVEGRVDAGRLLRRPRRHTRLLHGDVRPPVHALTARGAGRHARARLPGRCGERRARTAPGSPSTPATTATSWSRSACRTPGIEGARANLAAETADSYDFDATRAAAARHAGSSSSDQIEIDGRRRATGASPSTPRSTTRCCTRTWPATSTARYMGFDGQVHTADGYTPYQNFSLWDTYRPQNQLLELLDAGRRAGRRAVAAGDRPRRRLAAALGARQQRDQHHDRRPGDAVPGRDLVQGPARRPRGGGVRGCCARTPTSTPPAELALQRPHRQSTTTRERGYIPSGLGLGNDCAHKGGDNDCRHPASATLEYAAADAALALMADGPRPRPPTRGCSPAAASGTATCGTPSIGHVPAADGRRHLADPVRPGRRGHSSSTRAAPTSTSGWCRRTRPGWSR